MVLVFLADGFEEIEAVTVIDLLRRAGVETRVVGIDKKKVTGAHGITLCCDLQDTEADLKSVEMMVLPGGMPGAINLENSRTVQAFLSHCEQNNCFVAAICAAPTVLGHRNLLQGRRATCFPGMEEELYGAQYTGAAVETDGKIITGRAAGTAMDFALELVRALRGDEAARRVETSLVR